MTEVERLPDLDVIWRRLLGRVADLEDEIDRLRSAQIERTPDEGVTAMGLPGAWEGDPKAIGKFLRYMHGQLTQIGFGVPRGEFVMVMGSLTSECDRALRFAEGYGAALVEQPERPVSIGTEAVN